jgi:hypothetical protein
MLGNGTGLGGNTHLDFADENNEEVAGLMEQFLERKVLDGYTSYCIFYISVIEGQRGACVFISNYNCHLISGTF